MDKKPFKNKSFSNKPFSGGRKPFVKKSAEAPQALPRIPKTTSWGKVSAWYDDLVEKDDSYQIKVIAPNLLRLLGEVKGKNFLDLACGQGFFSRLLDSKGANVTGVDISKELIEYAKRKGGKNIS